MNDAFARGCWRLTQARCLRTIRYVQLRFRRQNLRRWMLMLSLIAALAGTPSRIIEAAYDLAGTMAEMDGGGVIEITDGGVGDDHDAAIHAESAQASWMADVSAPLPSIEPWGNPSHRAVRRRIEARMERHQPLSRRLALLQTFLC